MSTEKLVVEPRDHILLITLNRPQVRNACDYETACAMTRAMDLLDADPTLSLGVITGAGGNFSAGADLRSVAKGEPTGTPERGGFGIFEKPPGKPLIAAVEGYAVGGGLELCLCCDLIVAANDARLGFPEVKRGTIAGGGGLFRLPKRMPYHIAMDVLLTGELKSADYFHQFGLVTRVVEPGCALGEALAIGNVLLENGPLALRMTKEVASHALDWDEADAWQKQAPYFQKIRDSQDRIEGARAFAEKRKPEWRGA